MRADLISEDTKESVIGMFLSYKNNSAPNIAKTLNIKLCTVNRVLDVYLREKQKKVNKS